MTNKIIIFALTVLTFSACKKEDDLAIQSTTSQTDSKSITAPPTTFSQKLLLEIYSTASCATSPDAELKYRNFALQHPDKMYGVCIHNNDAMANAQYSYLNNQLNIGSYASGSFNRTPYNGAVVLPKTIWSSSIINNCLNKTSKCGLKISSSISGNLLTTKIYTGFNQPMNGNYFLTVYLMEDNVTGTGSGYNQANYYNNNSASPFYQLGNPIVGYSHSCVLRKVITASQGLSIPASSIQVGGTFAKSFSIDISNYNKANLYIIAFINKQGSSSITQEILNVQQVKAGQNKNWD